jgi:putative DNA primase/helicase
MNAYHRIVAALERHGCRRSGRTDWQCPAHDDNRASLSVSPASDRALLHCHAGCDPASVLAALGLTFADLFDGEGRRGKRPIVATYEYVDERGELLFQVVRFYPKDFRQRRPDGEGWTWNLRGVRRVPYHLPQLVEALRGGRPVYLVEGEKDVHAVERVGATATTIPGGADYWRAEYVDHFSGADVVVVADDDAAGRRHASRVASALGGVAESVRVVLPAVGKDAADHLDAGRTLMDFVPLISDGAWVRASEVQPEPVSWLWQDRIPHGMLTVVGGFPGVGKSTILYDVGARVTDQGKTVLVVTAEDHLSMVARPRLEAAGADLDRIHFRTDPMNLPEDCAVLEEDVRRMDASLLILDPLVAFISDEVNTHRDHHVRRVLAPLADLAESTGVAVLGSSTRTRTPATNP